MVSIDRDYEDMLQEFGIPYIKRNAKLWLTESSFDEFLDKKREAANKLQKPMSQWRDYSTDNYQ